MANLSHTIEYAAVVLGTKLACLFSAPAADRLGVSRPTLYDLMQRHGIGSEGGR